MGLEVCVLASGSSGNCIYVGNDETRILIDAGISCRVICSRLADIGVPPESIQALCVTHEHTDHHSGVAVLYRKLGLSLFGNAGTVEALSRSAKHCGLPWNVFTTGQSFRIGNLVVDPFRIPHDSYEPVAFVVSDENCRVGICTDLGVATDLVCARLRECDVLIIETNHDEDLVLASARPWSLKQRIIGNKGHLSNRRAAELLCEIASDRLQAVYLAHLSRDCNRPDLALETVRRQLVRAGFGHVDIQITHANQASKLWRYQSSIRGDNPDVCIASEAGVHLELAL
ncbi:MAG: MBL fold metallo-hydrolase [Kiritimatiellia bacterium]